MMTLSNAAHLNYLKFYNLKTSVPFPINDTPLKAKIYLKFFQLVETSALLDHLGNGLGLALAGGRRQDVGDTVQQD
jgi:hypothetical protein